MNQELWAKIEAFNFDELPTDYGFSIRLANENFWTSNFTQLAILEYKKFMYLAATSEFMVSPSEIVDTVWHQHLVFTQLYTDFAAVLGKQIQHIPSTHNKADFLKFKQAKERTKELYYSNFGQQPASIWQYNNMFDGLHLPKAKIKIRSFIVVGILAFLVLSVPAFYVLKPIYSQIDNPDFILEFIVITLIVFIALEMFTMLKLKKIIDGFDKSAFVFNLKPTEVVFCQTQNITNCVHIIVNQLFGNEAIIKNSDNSIDLAKNSKIAGNEQQQVAISLSALGNTRYTNLFAELVNKPIFKNIVNCMDAFMKYFIKSKKFGTLFYANFIVLALLFLLCFTRLVTGVVREKPVVFIAIFTCLLLLVIIFYLFRLTKRICTKIIPNLYKQKILPTIPRENNWEWDYLMLGAGAFTSTFHPLAVPIDRKGDFISSDGGSSGSSCGSSCSSCGGCGD